MAGSSENLRAIPGRMLSLFLSEWNKKDRRGFIQALINNGNDAIEVLKYMMKKDPATYLAEEAQSFPPPPKALSLAAGPAQPDFSALTGYYICVILDREQGSLSFVDNGIGMTKNDLNAFIGVLGNSVSLYLSPETGLKLLGVDGIGFYRSFVVSKKVLVTTKHPRDVQYVLEFGENEEGIVFDNYMITEDKVGPPLGRGTKVVVHFTNGNSEWYLSPNILKNFLIAGSKMATHPVYQWVQTGARGHWEILNPNPKVKQLFDLVMNEVHAGGVGWLTDGKGLYLTEDFYYNHMAKDSASNLESYLKQLNRLGFQYNKIGNRYEITHKQGLFDKADLQKVLSISNMYKKKARNKKEQEKQDSTEEKEEEQEKPGSTEEKEEEQEKPGNTEEKEEEQEKPGSTEKEEEQEKQGSTEEKEEEQE